MGILSKSACNQEGDREFIIYDDGDIGYYRNGLPHRDDGPAVIYNNGTKHWYKDGLRHREDGPAIVFDNGIEQWYFEGTSYTKEDYWKKLFKLGFITKAEYIAEVV